MDIGHISGMYCYTILGVTLNNDLMKNKTNRECNWVVWIVSRS